MFDKIKLINSLKNAITSTILIFLSFICFITTHILSKYYDTVEFLDFKIVTIICLWVAGSFLSYIGLALALDSEVY